MAIYIKNGNLFLADVEALINPVNTVGVMGKGLALQFKNKYPECFNLYVKACKDGTLKPGIVQIIIRESNPKYIINFPTKLDWRNPSKIEYIKEGLDDLITKIDIYNIISVAIPALGCGLGGLDWEEVKQLITDKFKNLNIKVLLYEP